MRSFRSWADTAALAVGILLLLAGAPLLWAQSVITLRGTVQTAYTLEPIRFVTVEEVHTRQRVMTDRSGGFLLRIPRTRLDSQYIVRLRLALSCIGYRRDTIEIPTADTTLSITLQEQSLLGREIVVRAEDPAVTIMRKVIERKARQSERLRTYTYTLYTKFIAATDTATALRSSGRGDTTVNSILESFSRGYVRLPDKFHNEIFQKRQSANVPPEANFVSFGTNLNIYDESVTIIGEEIASPLALDAIDIYDYQLMSSQDDDTVLIRVKPRSELRRGFVGTMYVDQRNNVPLEVQLVPNEAVNLPFGAQLTYRQNLMVVDSMVVPEALSITSTLEANILYVVAPRLDIDIETICYDYEINPEIDDDVFDRRRVETTTTAAEFDSTFWQTNLKLPLRPEEQRAYQEIQMILENPDSLQNSMIEQFLGPVTRLLQRLGRRPFTGFEDIFRYNLIHGAYVGIGLRDRPDTSILISAQLGYGLSDRRSYGALAASWFPDKAQRWGIEASYGHLLARRDDPAVVRQPLITFTSLLSGVDYGDYYLSTNLSIGASYSWGQLQFVRNDLWTRPNMFRIGYVNSADKSVEQSTQWSVFGPPANQRSNPMIANGRMSSASMDLFLSYSPLRRVSRTGMALSIEGADRSILGGDFSFVRAAWMAMARMRTMPLWTLDISANVRWGWGSVPPQRFSSSESGIGSLVVGSAFRGMRIKEFYGDRLASVQFSHNFGEVVPGLLRIPNIASFGIEFLLFGGVQWTSFSEATLSAYPTTLPTTASTADKTYFEVGMGINRILLFFRIDVNARLSQRDVPELRFTLTNATF
ncbi:MAG: carboxypeptidase-like regulatory domain-containing protein [Candidatus Kapabacteria bacterium]|nr:carboxypeptidase-like regulatory domain-containing protein [Candidatus Kapabacteria bacterium]